MASVVDHPAMLSHEANMDFVLYPGQDSAISDLLAHGPADPFAAANSLAEQYTSMAMSYDSFPAMTAPPQTMYENLNYMSKQRASPISAHSFENPPSSHSTGSASLASASSSTIGSPFSNASLGVHATDAWADGANVLSHEGYTQEYLPAGLDQEHLLYNTEKTPNTFVGECAQPSSLHSFSSSSSSSGRSRTPTVNTSLRASFVTESPTSIKGAFPPNAIYRAPKSVHFSSPSTPTSANSSYSSTGSRTLTGPRTTKADAFSCVENSPFFSQSSGNFVAPLESSYPSLIQPYPIQTGAHSAIHGDGNNFTFQPASPVPSHNSGYSQAPNSATLKAGSQSPFLHAAPYHPYQNFSGDRRLSVASIQSRLSGSPRSGSFDGEDDTVEKGRCPDPKCGKVFKDLKAHMLTHQSTRPEKCPIVTCEYHLKGFARRYDKNRHTLTHYKGTMVCGFCPGSGSPTEKSFNRADVFKRHLTQVHSVEQTPPNSRKKVSTSNSSKKLVGYAADATGKCSTCSSTFNNAQDFYEHLDDCVLRIVQQEDPSEAINERQLSSLDNDEEVEKTLKQNNLSSEAWIAPMSYSDEDEDASGDEDENAPDADRRVRSGKGGIKRSASDGKVRNTLGNAGVSKPRRGMTYSKGGVALVGKGGKKRKNFPISWGCSADKMKMKKRGIYVYDGSRRLWKDDLMLNSEFEVRWPLADGKSYITDLDVKTIERAVTLHNATDEEKGPWDPSRDVPSVDFDELMK
ncbi:MAG: hypothetical protein M1814_002986 [Vezdaea aestivalis]|nr:MAG: hypothetical protein M1814_002986 [Vezdaea aestivalis]